MTTILVPLALNRLEVFGWWATLNLSSTIMCVLRRVNPQYYLDSSVLWLETEQG